MEAICSCVDLAYNHYEATHGGWQDVIKTASEMLTLKVVNKLTVLLEEEDEAVQMDKDELVARWRSLFQGQPTYYSIRCGATGINERDDVVNKFDDFDHDEESAYVIHESGHEHFLHTINSMRT
jgi:hypothetical protein